MYATEAQMRCLERADFENSKAMKTQSFINVFKVTPVCQALASSHSFWHLTPQQLYDMAVLDLHGPGEESETQERKKDRLSITNLVGGRTRFKPRHFESIIYTLSDRLQ